MGRKRILVVDDEADILNLLEEAITNVGHEAETASSAAAALELIRDRSYDAAIVDFELPDMNGVMLHREMRQMDPDLAERTIFMSGLVEAQGYGSYYDAEGAGFVPKPFDVWGLLVMVFRLTGVHIREAPMKTSGREE